MLHYLLCALARYREDKARRDYALREIIHNGWESPLVSGRLRERKQAKVRRMYDDARKPI